MGVQFKLCFFVPLCEKIVIIQNYKTKNQMKILLSTLRFSIIIILSCAAVHISYAQQTFISAGRIEFERKLNLQKQLEDDSWLENLKDKIPQFRTDYFYLSFKDNKTLFEKEKDNDQKIPFFDDDKSLDDVTYTDLQTQKFVKKENVFEQVFLLSDSIRKIDWRITNDTREIAGFECRKAVGVVLDSIYVVAFYTDQITVSGGPFSFCNLPGMILGIAIPRLNITCFATKLELVEPTTSQLIAPSGKRTKPVDYKDLEVSLKKAMSDWDERYRMRYLVNFML
jgi:GLPGLI family protein